MLVGVNALLYDPRCPGGDGRYLRQVLAKMREIQPDTRFVVFTSPLSHDAFEGWDREYLDVQQKSGLFGGLDSQLDRAAKQRGVDLVFSSLLAAPARLSAPLVLYSMDLHYFEKDYLRDRRRTDVSVRDVKRICGRAAAIVAPSEFMQRKHLELLDIPLNHVIVAPLGVEDVFTQPNACAIEPPFLVSIGDTREFKNIPRLREAFDILKDEFDHTLIVVGRPCEAEPDDWGPRVMRIEYCSAAHLAGLLQHCDVCVQPSLYEGSGVAVLEAMRAGAPVATSRTGGIAEVAGDTPFYFNPENTSSIVSTVRWAIEEGPELRNSRVKFGRQVAGEFTWERCAWKTLSAFKRV